MLDYNKREDSYIAALEDLSTALHEQIESVQLAGIELLSDEVWEALERADYVIEGSTFSEACQKEEKRDDVPESWKE